MGRKRLFSGEGIVIPLNLSRPMEEVLRRMRVRMISILKEVEYVKRSKQR